MATKRRATTLDERVDELFSGPPDAFVATRDALVKELRAEGDKDGAAMVKGLRRPTVAAAAVNQLVHTRPADVAKLLELGDRLREAQDDLLQGRGRDTLREAMVERRKLVAQLAKRAVGLAGAGGEAQREAITNTLEAALTDPAAAADVAAGRLSKELAAPSGFGDGVGTPSDDGEAAPGATAARPSRQDRRASRAARRGERTPADAAQPAPDDGQALADDGARRARLARLKADADATTAEAQQAAREAAAARQEVSRLQDLLVTANAKSKAADERARLTQWTASTAQQALRDADADADAGRVS